MIANPLDGCGPMKPRPEFNDYLENWFVIVGRYNCTFEEKARHAQAAYYDGLIVYNVNSSDLGKYFRSYRNPCIFHVSVIGKGNF